MREIESCKFLLSCFKKVKIKNMWVEDNRTTKPRTPVIQTRLGVLQVFKVAESEYEVGLTSSGQGQRHLNVKSRKNLEVDKKSYPMFSRWLNPNLKLV